MTYASCSGAIALSSTSLTYNGASYNLALTPDSTYLDLSVTQMPVTYAWNVASGTSGNWGTAASWTPGTGTPGSIDTANFNLANNNLVNVDAPHTVATVSFGSSTGGQVSLSGSQLTVTNALTVAAGQTLTGTGSINASGGIGLGGTLGPASGSLTVGGVVSTLGTTGMINNISLGSGGYVSVGSGTTLTVGGTVAGSSAPGTSAAR